MFEINMKLYLIIVGLGIICFLMFIYYIKYIREGFEAVKFMSDIETANFLKADKDGYIKGFSKADLHARHVKTANEYLNIIVQSPLSFTYDEKVKLSRCIIKADEFLKDYVYMNILACKDIMVIPWKLALTEDDVYEEGFPHTREDVIFVSTRTLHEVDHDLTATLIHEKVHIYQRKNPKIMKDILNVLGYRELNVPRNKLQRSNPDLNNNTYYDTKNNRIMIFTYISDRPNGINDIKNSEHASHEHPYETIAYDIANEYIRNYLQGMLKRL